MSIDELIERFATLGVAQDDALLHDWHGKFNRLFDQMAAIGDELKRRGPEARLELQRLYSHQNLQVRLQAAKWTLGVAPVAARQVIQQIYDWKIPPQFFDAGMCLANLDDGRFKPD